MSTADVCLICEGTYPYLPGGVSTWIHDLLESQDGFTFQIVSLLADRTPRRLRFNLPGNVVGVSHVYLQDLEPGRRAGTHLRETLSQLEPHLLDIQRGHATLRQLAQMLRLLSSYQTSYGRRAFLNSEAAFHVLVGMYEKLVPGGSFLNYFWTWRSLMSGLFGTLPGPLPPAKVYHAISTGYAGLLAARARLQTGRPAMVTEHGIYTNERRIELTLADWLHKGGSTGLAESGERDLASIWYSSFKSYASICYDACERIITLCGSNQEQQRLEGADPARMSVIPNGIDLERFADLAPTERSRPTIALIGRVVPIKDIKTYVHACFHLRRRFPDLLALVLGGTDEDPGYFDECSALVEHLGLGTSFEFRGQVRIEEYLSQVDLVVLTSLSEVQPLTVLEAGAAAVPMVATNVGACREMILGSTDEMPRLGDGGAITPVASPVAMAEAIGRLLENAELRREAGRALRKRVQTYYSRPQMVSAYQDIYGELRQAPLSRPLS
jgi:polysaccharide biosynthesis protein PelF